MRLFANSIVPRVVSAVLLAAALAKLHDLIVVVEVDAKVAALTALIIIWEGVLSVWLALRPGSMLARSTAVGTFAAFTVSAAQKALDGDASCRCFGAVEIAPVAICVADFCLFTMLVLARDRSINFGGSAARLTTVVSFLAIVSGAVVLEHISDAAIVELASVTVDGSSKQKVRLDPYAWKGLPFPVFEFIDGGHAIRTGTWHVLMLRPGCPTCEAYLDSLKRRLRSDQLVLLNVMDDRATTPTLDVSDATKSFVLSRAHEWIVETPVLIGLRDGIVTNVGSLPAAGDREMVLEPEAAYLENFGALNPTRAAN